MKQLSLRQAAACENAQPGTPCKCRCGGALHGAARIRDDDAQAFAALADDDPHHHDAERRERSSFRTVDCGKCPSCRAGRACDHPITVEVPK